MENIFYYYIQRPSFEVNFNVHEAEIYSAALVVQPLIGNLISYGNSGNFEPRLAYKWERLNETTWDFYLKSDLYCENNEPITPNSFKESIERSIKFMQKRGGVPVLNQLVGFDDFINGKNNKLDGIEVFNEVIRFKFKRPIRDGVVQVLSFAPFGYISRENYNENGEWRDNFKIISSGPYSVESFEFKKMYKLKLRDSWKKRFNSMGFENIVITNQLNLENMPKYFSIDIQKELDNINYKLNLLKIIPDYLNSVILGNLDEGIFKDQKFRSLFKSKFYKYHSELPDHWENHFKTNSFYSSFKKKDEIGLIADFITPEMDKVLLIEGSEPDEKNKFYKTWITLKKTLDLFGLKYKFANNVRDFKNLQSNRYDLKIVSAQIGGGVEAWALDILFCSQVGMLYPDIDKKICQLVSQFNSNYISEADLVEKFQTFVEADATILPVSHYGPFLYFSKNIKLDNLSPSLMILRFEDMSFYNE